MKFFKGGFLGLWVKDIFTMHDCVSFLSIYRKNKIVVCISPSGKFVEHIGGARQNSQTETPSNFVPGTNASAIMLIGLML